MPALPPFFARLACCLAILSCLVVPAALRADEKPAGVTLAGLGAKVDVYFDSHGVPNIYASTWTDAARTLGYLHARDRLGQMDLFRRQASGTMAEIRGKDALKDDILVRKLGIRKGCESYWAASGFPPDLKAELEAYAEGVNRRMAELDNDHLPLVCKALGYRPAAWTPVDSLVFTKYMGWDQAGTDDDLWLGMMAEKLGASTVEELWPLERPYEIPTVARQASREKLSQRPIVPIPGASAAYAAAMKNLNWHRWLGEAGSFGSNNWAVDGTKTVSGKPILCSDPHLGFSLPSIWYTAHLSVAGKSVAGVTFAGTPSVIIGINDHHAWGLTNMQADAVDYFVETVDPKDPLRYKHRGEWKTMQRTTENVPVKGQPAFELTIDATIHGPVISREGRTITMAWTGLGPTSDPEAIWKMNRAGTFKEFMEGLNHLEVPALNVCYADVEGNIAMHPCGRLPLRLAGQGRIPMDGASGDNDWQGWIPRNELPLEINPARHFVASANNRPAPLGYPHYVGWMWDPSYRIRRIHEMLTPARGLTIATMGLLQNDALDMAAERFLPILIAAVRKADLKDPQAREILDTVAGWNYIASPEALGPMIWLRWFEAYRDAVWKNKWPARGIEEKGGSWGFNSTNRREPIIEVLEYLTRQQPGSPWFDDPTTPIREDRDALAVRSFASAVERIKKEFGTDREKWRWKNINRLYLPSLTGQSILARAGGPIPGTAYTVNPGSDVGRVTGGASWRMIVDFARVADSVGVYPGGQSESPASTHYADQMGIWGTGRYLPLNIVGDPARLPAGVRSSKLVFTPGP
jgi:penicillin amidase